MLSRILRIGFLTLCLALSPLGWAQTPPVTVAPPHIEFAPWKEEGKTATATEYSASFPSAIETAQAANNTVPLRIFIPSKTTGPVPVVLVLHYWGARDLRVERALAGQLTARGVAAVLMTLPYHLARTPAGYSSGELAIQPDPAALVVTMTQSVSDARRSIDFIVSHPEFDSSRIGISGTSLGSIVSSLTYAVEPRISEASFALGGVDLARILWTSSRVVQQREAMRRRGMTEAKLREALTPVEPKLFLPGRVGGSAFVIGGRYDTVVPAATTQELINALDKPKVLWLETGHYGGVFAQRKLLREVSTFFADEFDHRTYVPPTRIFAPTVRLGFLATAGTQSSFDVGIGLDFFRTHTRLETFGTLLITPRGPQLYLGRQLDRGFSIGVVGGARRIGVGLMWSAIL